MTKRLKFYQFTIFLLLVSTNLFADDRDEINKDTPVFRQGTWKGQTVDTEIWSHAQQPNPEQIKAISQYIPAGEIGNYHIFQNLKHENSWQLAAVPKEVGHVKLYLQEMALQGKVSHAFMGYHFDKPVIVMNKDGSGKPQFIHDIIVSNDGARPIGQGFDAIKGFGPNLILHTNFTSLKQVYTDYGMADPKNAKMVTQFRIPQLNAESRNQLLSNALSLSMETGYSRVYSTLSSNNCCGQVFALLDSVLPKPGFLKGCRIGLNHVASFMPGLFRDAMTVRNLYNKSNEGLLINDPQFRSMISQK